MGFTLFYLHKILAILTAASSLSFFPLRFSYNGSTVSFKQTAANEFCPDEIELKGETIFNQFS